MEPSQFVKDVGRAAKQFYFFFHFLGFVLLVSLQTPFSNDLTNFRFVIPAQFIITVILAFYFFLISGLNTGNPYPNDEFELNSNKSGRNQKEDNFNEAIMLSQSQQGFSLLLKIIEKMKNNIQSRDSAIFVSIYSPIEPSIAINAKDAYQNMITIASGSVNFILTLIFSWVCWRIESSIILGFFIFLIDSELRSISICKRKYFYAMDNYSTFDQYTGKDHYDVEYMPLCFFAFLALCFLVFTGVLSIYHTMLILTGQTTWEHTKRNSITYFQLYPRFYNPFDYGIKKNIQIVFMHGNKLRNWELPSKDEAIILAKNKFNWIENEYYSCC